MDATNDDGHPERLLNHSKTSPNVVTKLVEIGGVPHLCFFTSKCVNIGEELVYDYGDRRRIAIEDNKWLTE